MKGKFRKGVFILTYRRGKGKAVYLLLKRKLHWIGWEFPKGGVEGKEIAKKTLVRELKEETGQKPIKIIRFNVRGKYKYSRRLIDRKGCIGQTYSLFAAEIKSKTIKLDKREHSSYRWVNFKKAIELLRWPNQRKCLRIVNNKLEK